MNSAHHTVSGLFSTCRVKLRATDDVSLLTWKGVTCEACLAPKARRGANAIMRGDIANWGTDSVAWAVRDEVRL